MHELLAGFALRPLGGVVPFANTDG